MVLSSFPVRHSDRLWDLFCNSCLLRELQHIGCVSARSFRQKAAGRNLSYENRCFCAGSCGIICLLSRKLMQLDCRCIYARVLCGPSRPPLCRSGISFATAVCSESCSTSAVSQPGASDRRPLAAISHMKTGVFVLAAAES